MCEQALNEAAVLIRPHGMVSAERQHNQLHKEEEPDPVEEAADNEVLAQEIQLSAGQAIHSSSRESDEVVDAEAEDVLAG